MHQGAPLCLAEAHRFETLIQLLPPGAGGAVQQLTNYFTLGHSAGPNWLVC